jgi:tmRNA-binding protein
VNYGRFSSRKKLSLAKPVKEPDFDRLNPRRTAVSAAETYSTKRPASTAKVEIALARGKQKHDKRADLAKRDDERRIERALREKYR